MKKTLARVIVTEEDGVQGTLIDVYKLSVKDMDYIIKELQGQKKLMEKWEKEDQSGEALERKEDESL